MKILDAMRLPCRTWATRGDKQLEIVVPLEIHDASSDAISGVYGVAWWEFFEASDGSRYRVRCFDGVYKSKGAYKNEQQEDVAVVAACPEKLVSVGDAMRKPGRLR